MAVNPLARLAPSLAKACSRALSESHARLKASSLRQQNVTIAPGTRLDGPMWNDVEYKGLNRSFSEDPKPPRCGRFVVDSFTSYVEQKRLKDSLDHAFQVIPTFNGDTSITPPQDPVLAEEGILPGFDFHSVSLINEITRRMQLTVSDTFGVNFCDLQLAGTLASKLSPPADPRVPGYWNPHVDKANRVLYDFSAILYLTTCDDDFFGGRFVFLDVDNNNEHEATNDDNDLQVTRRIVVPRAGRFVSFTSGIENVHCVEKVLSGERYTLSAWFTYGKGSVDAIPTHQN